MNIPAGVLPSDGNIELFANPEQFGKCFFTRYGKTSPFNELPSDITRILSNELSKNVQAINGLKCMGFSRYSDMLEAFNYCNRGRFDNIPDITSGGNLTKEYFDCGRHGNCPGEGKVCSMTFDNEKITHRERECLALVGNGKSYREIMVSMGFRSMASVNSIMARLKEKLNERSKTGLAIHARQIGIV